MEKKHNSGAPSVRKFGYPSVREIYAVTCSHMTNLNHRLTNVKYMHVIQSTYVWQPKCNSRRFAGKSHGHPRLVKQRQLHIKSQ